VLLLDQLLLVLKQEEEFIQLLMVLLSLWCHAIKEMDINQLQIVETAMNVQEKPQDVVLVKQTKLHAKHAGLDLEILLPLVLLLALLVLENAPNVIVLVLVVLKNALKPKMDHILLQIMLSLNAQKMLPNVNGTQSQSQLLQQ